MEDQNKRIPIIQAIKEIINAENWPKDSVFYQALIQNSITTDKLIEEIEIAKKSLIDFIRLPLQELDRYVNPMLELAANIQEGFKNFEENSKQAANILRKYKWFISPHAPLDFVWAVIDIAHDQKRHDKEINELFLHYYTSDNWAGIENMIQSWNKNKLMQKRFRIIKDCLNVIKNCDRRINCANVVLPTLIIQIDGSINDFLIKKGHKWDFGGYSKQEKSGRILSGRKTLLKSYKADYFSNPFYKNVEDIILDFLFQTALARKPLKKPYGFNRHKILHGENTNYGRRVHIIRAFLILEYLTLLR